MSSNERGADRGSRLGRRGVIEAGSDIRTARVGLGTSLETVGRAVGLSYSQVGRIERGLHPNVTVLQLARIAGTVGLSLSIRTYPTGAPIRDAAQVALLSRFRRRLQPDLRLEMEVPMPISGDQRAWDGMVTGTGGRTAVEAITRLADVQAVIRRIALKQRDSSVDRVVLLLSDTLSNRASVRAAEALIVDAYPVGAREALSRLGLGRHPSASTIIFL